MSRICCMRFSDHIKSLSNSGHAYFQMRSNVILIIAMQCTNSRTDILQRFVYSQVTCTIFKGGKMNHSCLCMFCDHEAVAQLVSCNLAWLYHHCTIYISFNLLCFATDFYSIYIPCISISVSDEYFFICDYFGNSCNPNQNSSVAQIFCSFWLYANCESPFRF